MRFVQVAFFVSSCAAGIFGAACGSSTAAPSSSDDGGGSEAASGDDAAPDVVEAGPAYPAFVPTDVPQVVSAGGPVLKSPKIVPVFFASDDAASTATIADFISKIGGTTYWTAATSEYGVGAATSATPVQLLAADNPPTTYDDTQIQTWLAGKLNANDPAFGTPDANTVYALFFPTGVTITLGGGGGGGGGGDAGADADAGGGGGGGQPSCVAGSFGGYHGDIQLDAAHSAMNVAYAVMPRCPGFNGQTVMDTLTGTTSHELAEATSDPYPNANPAYATVDSHHGYWRSLLGGTENGDMCAQNPDSFGPFAGLPNAVQRIWSNKAAMAGADPCVPAPASPVYFNTLPVLNDTIAVTTGGGSTTYKGVHIPVGQSGTVELDLFSLAPTPGPWKVKAIDANYIRTGTAALKFAFDKTQGQNGDKIQMTITVVTAGRRNTMPFLIESALNTPTQTYYQFWAGVVGN